LNKQLITGRRAVRTRPVKLHRLTINLGARWDWYNASFRRRTNPASNFTQAVPRRDQNVPNWNDWATRTGVAWDLFGERKTASRRSAALRRRHALGHHVADQPDLQPDRYPHLDDLNHDGTVVNPDRSVQFNEIGPPNNRLFGTLAGVTQVDPNLQRDKNWTYELTGSHEVVTFAVRVQGTFNDFRSAAGQS